MVYNAPNYRLMGSYIDNMADAKLKKDDADTRFQDNYFNGNILLGKQSELKNQLNEIMAQADYSRIPPRTRPTVIDKLKEGDPQDKLNERQYAEASNTYTTELNGSNEPVDQQIINPYTHHSNNDNIPQIKPYMKGNNRRMISEDWSLIKTLVIVIILIGVIYLFLNMIFQDRVSHQVVPGNMNLPGSFDTETNQ